MWVATQGRMSCKRLHESSHADAGPGACALFPVSTGGDQEDACSCPLRLLRGAPRCRVAQPGFHFLRVPAQRARAVLARCRAVAQARMPADRGHANARALGYVLDREGYLVHRYAARVNWRPALPTGASGIARVIRLTTHATAIPHSRIIPNNIPSRSPSAVRL